MKHTMSAVFAVVTLLIAINPAVYATAGTDLDAKPSTTAERLAARKAAVNEKLTEVQTAKIQEKCSAAQTTISKSSSAVTGYNSPIIDKYQALITQLNSVMQKWASNGKTNATLNSDVATLTQKYQTYRTAYNSVTVDFTDLTALNCKADPAGFSATVKQARTDLEVMRSARADLKTFTKDTVLKDLQTARKES